MASASGRRLPPVGVLLFLAYAFLILGGIGVSLRWVVDQAIATPLSIPGIVVMVLLAYTIFTITLVLQRKQAARGLAVGLSTLTIPAVPLLLLGPVPVVALVPAVVGVALFAGLRRPAVRTWLSEP
jgi:FtsH-binding integral membrane protein